MKKVHILKLWHPYQRLKELIIPSSIHLLKRHLLNGCQIHQNYSSKVLQPKEKIIFNGIVQSPFPNIPEINSDCTLDKFIWQHMDNWPNHIAVECGITGQKYTYAELRILCKKFATALQNRGYRPGQVLSIMLPNSPDYAIATLGAIEAGMIVSPINPIYTAYELSHQLHNNGAIALIIQSNLLSILGSAVELIKTTHKTDYKIDVIVANNNVTVPSGATNFKDMISDHIDHSKLRPTNRTKEDVVILPYSSGTTGLSKGVQLTHKNCVSIILQLETPDTYHFFPTTNDHQDVLPGFLPFFHIYGFVLIIIRGLSHGVKIVTLPKFQAASFLSVLKDHRATILYGVPPIIMFLGNHPDVTNEHVASLRLIASGAGPIRSTDAEKVLNRFKAKFIINQGYGLTETSSVAFLASQNTHDHSSVGKPLRSTYAKVVKLDGSIAGPEESGEIYIKGPQVMSGYLNRPDATKEVIDDEKFFRSGDVGYYDVDGKFYITDRLKELIKVKGFQVQKNVEKLYFYVPPAELEALLRTHGEVTDAAVIGIPDNRMGEKPMAFVVTKNKNRVNEQELIEFVSTKVAPYKQLAKVKFVDDIPVSPSGKILRRILRDEFLSSN